MNQEEQGPQEPTGAQPPPPEAGSQRPRRSPRTIPPPHNPETGGFLCDIMLGRLARELRVLGMDVEYRRNLGGMLAYKQARASGRTFLTRNKRLAALPGSVLIQSQVGAEQVAQVKGEPVVSVETPAEEAAARDAAAARPVPARPADEAARPVPSRPAPEKPRPEEPAFGRCLQCNTPLEKLSREQARPLVPFFIYQIHYDFRGCPKCKQVFWPGSHVQNMERRAQPAPARRSYRRPRN
jgi:uncharacterized protein with PIN domain